MGSGFRFTEQHLDGLLTGAHAFATGPKNLRTRDGTDLLKAYSELRLSRHGQDHHRRFADVFYAVDQALGRSVRDFYPNDLAIAASSFASVNCDAPRFFRDLLRNADHCFAEHRNSILKFESASDVLRACAALGWFDEDALGRLGRKGNQDIDWRNPPHVIFAGLSFLDRQRLTIDVDARRLALKGAGKQPPRPVAKMFRGRSMYAALEEPGMIL